MHRVRIPVTFFRRHGFPIGDHLRSLLFGGTGDDDLEARIVSNALVTKIADSQAIVPINALETMRASRSSSPVPPNSSERRWSPIGKPWRLKNVTGIRTRCTIPRRPGRPCGFARQDEFLPILDFWLANKTSPPCIPDANYLPSHLSGLAMRSSPAARAVILAHFDSMLSALGSIPKANQRSFVHHLILRLDHDDPELSVLTLHPHLFEFTGQELGKTWPGYRLGRPTLSEGPQAQALVGKNGGAPARGDEQRGGGVFVPG